ncbi:MAG: hypothetical protein M3Y33_13765 [Actinomycetota bacterium]|nr:hypothetical protein [Actinomycetota bacterium]
MSYVRAMNPQQPAAYPPLPPQAPSQGHKAPSERRWLIPVLAAAGGVVLGALIGVPAGRASAGPDRVVTEYGGLVTVTPAVTVTARPSAAVHQAPRGPGTTMGAGGASGVYVVGADIKAGTWHTSGAVGGTGGNCYVALLSALTAANDSNIISNDDITGPDTITVGAGVKAVQVNGCETWVRTGP